LLDSSFILSYRHSFGAGISRNRNSMEFRTSESPCTKKQNRFIIPSLNLTQNPDW
jgi:hypothetical protein